MAFKGIVTTKDDKAGVTLEAKVVSPLKHKSARKRFNVTINGKGLSDLECCLLDKESLYNKLKNSFDLDNLINGIESVITYSGANGTTIEYSVTSSIKPYIGSNGVLIKRPTLEVGDVSGTLKITVSKNAESVSVDVPITIKGYTYEESVFSITDAIIWDTIKGGNGSYTQKGYENINRNLGFVQAIKTSDIGINKFFSASSLPISYKVEDVINKERITSEGTINLLSYVDAAKIADEHISGVTVSFIDNTQSVTASNKRVKINGLTITATINIGEGYNPVVKTYKCSTISSLITNNEIMDNIIKKQISLTFGSSKETYSESVETAQVKTVLATQNNGQSTYTIKAFSDSGCETLTDSSLDMIGTSSNNTVSGARCSHSLLASTGNNETSPIPVIIESNVFGGGFGEADGYFVPLTINFDELKKYMDNGTVSGTSYEFYIMTEITLSSYDKSTAITNLCKKVNIDMSGYTISSQATAQTSE